MVNKSNYREMKLKQQKMSNELYILESELISYERTLPENIKKTRSILQYGYDIDDNGNIFSTGKDFKYNEK